MPQLQHSLGIGDSAALSRYAATVRSGALFSIILTSLADLSPDAAAANHHGKPASAAGPPQGRSTCETPVGIRRSCSRRFERRKWLSWLLCCGGGRQELFTLTVSGLALATLATSVAPTARAVCVAQVAAVS